ncbi:hypothetical protein VP1G_00815 [Cytospora mali]|uniref:Uncharacterized protein n=1 Tax=Cytospora mali TaxID=578113 RepID=A0A194UND5_CYTMA|nr:hypothetical protein VP1G_00815 [Valsa mali var. pyri (nom. inval.)]
MWAYDDGRGRRARDVPSSRQAPYYYDDAYDQAAPRSSRAAYEDPLSQAQPPSRDRHRRKSIHADPDEPRSSRRHVPAGVSVVASDDDPEYRHGRSSRDVYGSSHPERSSRHDAEAKTSDRNRHFRDKRGSWENGEAENLRRAKSYSPRRAAREAEAEPTRGVSPHASKSGWPEDDYAQGSGHHRSSKKSKAPKQYYEDDPRAGNTAEQPPHGRTWDRASPGYDYPPSAADMPRPPMGDQPPYKSALKSQPAPEEKPSKHSRRREKDYYGSGYDDAPTNGAGYDRGAYSGVDEPPRRSHRSKRHEDKPGRGDDAYQPQSQRGRHRSQPPQDDYEEADPYERVQHRPRHRQSMPPQARSRYPDDAYGDNYGQAKPPRRASSMNHGDPRRKQYYEDAYGRSGGSGSGSGGSGKDKKGRKWQKQAGQLFMTHAVPVIKKEAVPFLTKAAQAYIEQQRAR